MAVKTPTVFNRIAVLFNEPICIELDPPEAPGRPRYPDHALIQTILKEIREDGFDVRAVVVLGGKYPYYYNDPKNWGFVTDLKTWHRTSDATPYKPVGVKWLTTPLVTDYYWPEELVLLHSAMPEREVKFLVEQNQ